MTQSKTATQEANKPSAAPVKIPPFDAVYDAVQHAREVKRGYSLLTADDPGAEPVDPLEGLEGFDAYAARVKQLLDTGRGAQGAAYRNNSDIRAISPEAAVAVKRYAELLQVWVEQRIDGQVEPLTLEYLEMGCTLPEAKQFIAALIPPSYLLAVQSGDLQKKVTAGKRKSTQEAKRRGGE